MRRRATRVHPVLLGVALALVLLLGALLLPGGRPPEAGPAAAGPAAEDRTVPLAVLRAWDRDRAAAWRSGDPRALRRLYVAGSAAGRADRAMLAAYLDRGLRVTGLRMQVASAEVQYADGDRIVLRLTERLAATATATGAPGDLRLPGDGWSCRRVVLVDDGERWRVASAVAQASAVASTASTSGSEKS